MMTIRFMCSQSKCDRSVGVVVSAEFYRADLPLQSYVPRGWRVRAPRAVGSAAFAYCPQHAEGALER